MPLPAPATAMLELAAISQMGSSSDGRVTVVLCLAIFRSVRSALRAGDESVLSATEVAAGTVEIDSDQCFQVWSRSSLQYMPPGLCPAMRVFPLETSARGRIPALAPIRNHFRSERLHV